MKSIERRLSALEGDSKQEDLVCVGHQWVGADGKPSTEYTEKWVPRSRVKPLEFLFKDSGEDEEPEPRGPYLLLHWRENRQP